MNIKEAKLKYGEIKNCRWPDEDKWCKSYPIPFSWFPVRKIYCNEDMYYFLLRALTLLGNCGAHKEIYTYDGCFNIRGKKSDPTTISTHAYALAIDLNAEIMPYGSRSLWTPKFVKCFNDSGFDWGGNFKKPDPMHFQISNLW
jgi:hypothetical protein